MATGKLLNKMLDYRIDYNYFTYYIPDIYINNVSITLQLDHYQVVATPGGHRVICLVLPYNQPSLWGCSSLTFMLTS